MTINSPSGDHDTDNNLYASILEFSVMVTALDHFYREVVEGNLPLTNRGDPTEQWWEQRIVVERVNGYSRNWCVMFEALAKLRSRIEDQGVGHHLVKIDENLNFTYQGRRGRNGEDGEKITWESND